MRELSNSLYVNSHDALEANISLESIRIKGSSQIIEKVPVVSTEFTVNLDYLKIYKEAYEECENNWTCGNITYSFTNMVQIISDQYYDELQYKDLSRAERRNLSSQYMLDNINGDNPLFYRDVFRFYQNQSDFYDRLLDNNILKHMTLIQELRNNMTLYIQEFSP